MFPKSTSSSIPSSRRTDIISVVQSTCSPYLELTRFRSPSGILYLYFPCLFGTFFVAIISTSVSISAVLHTNIIFFLGCTLVRSAGCSWNDLVDRDLDRRVSRTCHRPIARGAISPLRAFIFTTVQVAIGVILLLWLLPLPCFFWSIPSMVLTAAYPFAKRITHYPQIILGLVFSWGVILAFPALDVDKFQCSTTEWAAAGCLYTSCVIWTVLYDTVYAGQDVKDDMRTGIKSIPVYYGSHTRMLLVETAVLQEAFLIATGFLIMAGPAYFVGTCIGSILPLSIMILKVDLGSPANCAWWFKNGCLTVGLGISSGFIGEFYSRSISRS